MISKYISEKEAFGSATAQRLGIDNTPNPIALQNMKEVANILFDRIREWYGKPLRVGSFYRSIKLNQAIGGAKNSQHVLGEAIDFDAGTPSENKKIFDWFIKSGLPFDQVIWEFGGDWIHISYTTERPNRMEVLEAEKVGGKTVYKKIK